MRKLALLVPLPFLVAFAAWGSARVADTIGVALGAALSAVATVVGAEQRPVEEKVDPGARLPIFGTDAPLGEASVAGATGAKRGKGRSEPAQPTHRSVFVSAQKVLALSEARVTPKGVRVDAKGARPAGLALFGVEGLGIGLRDGDVLTRALGQPALSSSAVVRAILVARANRVKVLEGEFYRGTERWTLHVEQPYLDDNRFARVKVTLRER
ncbi:MAG TPA: hypothetical protein VMS65_10020 [Polyangiaceae bacterium]|nr:hypothetical protein [Polyangiaceae bacterium]